MPKHYVCRVTLYALVSLCGLKTPSSIAVPENSDNLHYELVGFAKYVCFAILFFHSLGVYTEK